MIKKLITGMKKHQKVFRFSYKGIRKDFRKYQKLSPSFRSFLDKIARKNGYIIGILSSCCITICEEDDLEYVILEFQYLTTKREERQIDRKVKSISKKFAKGSRVDKIRSVHDYIVQHMEYCSSYYSPYDAIVKEKGICMSYALFFQRVMQELKIPCLYVKGKNHAWNLVRIGNYWYNIDVTWDDNRRDSYRYFLKSDSDFPGHKRIPSSMYRSLKMAKKSY